MNVVVLGGGLVGLPMALDLVENQEFKVTLVDNRQKRLDEIHEKYNLEIYQADLSGARQIENAVRNANIVVNAVPGNLGFQVLKTVIEQGKNVVDITFAPEDFLKLDKLAKEHGVVAICDIGVAPGMSNILTAYSNNKLDRTERIRIYVGGLPKIRQWPFEYRAVFSPADVIEEYTRTARFVRDGKMIEMPALSETELIDLPGVGTLEAFNSDGLRSLLHTVDCPDIIEKTLRYPGHVEKMRLFRDTGFFSREPVSIDGHMIRPLDLTSRLLFPMWELGSEEDLTIMQIIVEGTKNKKKTVYTWDLLDYYDRKKNIHSMARVTGYTATAAVRLMAAGRYDRQGISPPEYLAEDEEIVRFILEDLKRKGVNYRESVKFI